MDAAKQFPRTYVFKGRVITPCELYPIIPFSQTKKLVHNCIFNKQRLGTALHTRNTLNWSIQDYIVTNEWQCTLPSNCTVICLMLVILGAFFCYISINLSTPPLVIFMFQGVNILRYRCVHFQSLRAFTLLV